jgi:hypothetical protein
MIAGFREGEEDRAQTILLAALGTSGRLHQGIDEILSILRIVSRAFRSCWRGPLFQGEVSEEA